MQAQMSEMAQQLERIEALLAGGDDAEDGTAQGI
jgi:hypothetical protein